MTYEEACAAHSWQVPERYNIAADVCDKHPRDKLAMIH
jgi:acetyl-CoA synthetase